MSQRADCIFIVLSKGHKKFTAFQAVINHSSNPRCSSHTHFSCLGISAPQLTQHTDETAIGCRSNMTCEDIWNCLTPSPLVTVSLTQSISAIVCFLANPPSPSVRTSYVNGPIRRNHATYPLNDSQYHSQGVPFPPRLEDH